MTVYNKKKYLSGGGSCPLGAANSSQIHMSLNAGLSHLPGEPIHRQENMVSEMSGSAPTPTNC